MKEYFKENKYGQLSMMRLLSFITVITAVLIAVSAVCYSFFAGESSAEILKQVSLLCGIMLTAGFGGKAVQKFTEG